jgi:hypothetical protein
MPHLEKNGFSRKLGTWVEESDDVFLLDSIWSMLEIGISI